MKRLSIWFPVLFAMMLGITGCGDEETGGTGATGGSNGGDFCSSICNSPCVGNLGTGDVQACLDGCSMSGVFGNCESQTTAFIDCLEANDCGESGATACANQATAFGQCFSTTM